MKKKRIKVVLAIYFLFLSVFCLWKYTTKRKESTERQKDLEEFSSKEELNSKNKIKFRDSISLFRKPFPKWDTLSVNEPPEGKALLRFYTDRPVHVLVIQDTRNVLFSDSVQSQGPNPDIVRLNRTKEALVVINHEQTLNISIEDLHVADLYYQGWLNRVSVIRFDSSANRQTETPQR
ncbi:MAG: hypothetical protein K1X92_01080 [Bacteroidia bacterium]|nr:hypothetical protein [Bacteroidia bacterium]